MPRPPNKLTAIVILGAAVLPDGRPSPTLLRRIARGARAWQPGDIVIPSGGQGEHGEREAIVMARERERLGVDPSAIRPEGRATSTLENAIFSMDIGKTEGVDRYGIVTDLYHLPRALLTFRLLGARATGLAVPITAETSPRVFLWQSLRELVALPVYTLKLLARRRDISQ